MSVDLTITRFAYTEMGTFGRLLVEGQVLFTVERPWLGNQPCISCIPEGKYFCGPRYYNRGGYEAIEVRDVPNRTHILFHKGNRMHDVQGCIAITSRLGALGGVWAGLESKTAFALFMEHFGGREFALEIARHAPEEMRAVELG